MSALPESIGRYQVRRELGRGMMGVVYLALDPDLGRDIALKVIQLPHGASEADRTSFEQRFFSEAKSAARLSHPGIVIVHDVGRDATTGAVFMALELLPGRTLESTIKEGKRLDGPVALRIARRVAEALQHAHSQGVVHRDIKPANIMILPSGEPKIMDFGIAKVETAHQTATGQFVGTPLYMSPEQALAHPVDGRSDLFSLGSVLYEMLTGTAAFAGESITKVLFQLINSDPAPPSRLVATLSPEVDHLLGRLPGQERGRPLPECPGSGRRNFGRPRETGAGPGPRLCPGSPAPRKPWRRGGRWTCLRPPEVLSPRCRTGASTKPARCPRYR